MSVAKIGDKIHLGHPTRKSVFGVSFWERLKLVCSATETNYTPYNRLFWRHIIVSKTDGGKFGRKREGEDFVFAKFNIRICAPLLVMEKVLSVWRYCSSNLSLFHAQISFLSALQHRSFKKIAEKQLSAPVERLGNKIYYNHVVTLKLQLSTSIYGNFGHKVAFNNRTTRPRRDKVSEKLMFSKTKQKWRAVVDVILWNISSVVDYIRWRSDLPTETSIF